ncbi:MAG: hypothetical protein AB7K68_01515 [Bacteriovoracia bacterium]
MKMPGFFFCGDRAAVYNFGVRGFRLKAVLFFSALALPASIFSFAAEKFDPTIGGEIELTNEAMQSSGFSGKGNTSEIPEKKSQLKFVEELRKRCVLSKCAIKEVAGKQIQEFRVTYPDGWWFQVSFDPGCVEILFKPSTLADLEAVRERIDKDIFAVGKAVGIGADKLDSAHFNVGLKSAFGDDAELFLRYFVDYANHYDLALGSLGHDTSNGPPLALLRPEQRDALQQVVEDFYSGKLKTVEDIAKEINKKVYTHTLEPGWLNYHNQAMGLKGFENPEAARFELRSIWAQDSAENLLQLGRLVKARINFLRTQKGRIVYLKGARDEFFLDELKARYLVYVEESGLKFKDYENLLPDDVRSEPLPKFFRERGKGKKNIALPKEYEDLLQISPWVRERTSIGCQDAFSRL